MWFQCLECLGEVHIFKLDAWAAGAAVAVGNGALASGAGGLFAFSSRLPHCRLPSSQGSWFLNSFTSQELSILCSIRYVVVN